MVSVRFVQIILLSVMSMTLYGCDTSGTAPELSRKPLPTDLLKAESRKLAVVSAVFLAAEKERMNIQSHEITTEFSKDGSGVAYIEPYDGKFHVVHNGKVGKTYLDISDLSISSDGMRVAYVGRVDDKTRKMVVDSREGLVYGENDNHMFSPDGKHHLSTFSQGEKRYIVIDNTLRKEYLLEQNPMFSSDSLSIAFQARTLDGRGKQFVISDLNLQSSAVFVSCGDYTIQSDDKSRIAAVCSENGKSIIKVIDFLKRTVLSNTRYDGTITHFKFAADNRSLAFTVVRKGEKRFVVYDSKEEMIPAGDEFFTDPIVLSEPEGVGAAIGTVYKSYFYYAFQKRSRNEKGYGYISDLAASSDGRHHAYVAVDVNEERAHIVVDGREGSKFDKIVAPLFSPDGVLAQKLPRQVWMFLGECVDPTT